MTDEPLWILGGGGHAKVVIATARAAGFTNILVADDARPLGDTVLGAPVQQRVSTILADRNARAVFAIGDNRRRFELAQQATCRFTSVIHPSAIVDGSVTLGDGSVVFAGAIIQPDTTLGAHAIVNTAASIDHDCLLGAAVHVAPGTRLAGNVTLGDGVFLGIGAVVIPGISIDAWARVGAGAAVVRALPSGVTAIGVPARVRE